MQLLGTLVTRAVHDRLSTAAPVCQNIQKGCSITHALASTERRLRHRCQPLAFMLLLAGTVSVYVEPVQCMHVGGR